MQLRALVLLLAAFPIAAESLAQSCDAKPDGNQMYIRRPNCDAAAPCFPGQAQAMRIDKRTYCYPPYIPCPGYTIQACDHIDWNFGDGTFAATLGDPNITHTWKSPGLYSIDATVTNPNGVGYVHEAVIIAVQPLVLISFADPSYTVSETAGSVTAKLRRSGDTTRRVTIDYRTGYAIGTIDSNLAIVAGKVTFESGETTKTITIPVINDNVYNGDSYHYVWIECYNGDAILPEVFMGTTQIHIVEDDRPATATARSVRVLEGDSGTTLLKIPITLSTPLPDAIHFWWTLWDGTAKRTNDWLGPDPSLVSGEIVIPAGSTQGEFAVQIVGDTIPEPDEEFRLEFVRSGGPGIAIDGSPVSITILNDDLSFAAEPVLIPAGQRQRLTLITGSVVATAAKLESNDPGVVEVPASVTLSGGSATSFDVVPVRPGIATIRATIDGTAKSATTPVTVYQPLVVLFEPRSIDVREKSSVTATLRVDPPPGQQQRALLTTTQPSFLQIPSSVIVSSGGRATFPIEGRAAGRAIVIATLPDHAGQPNGALSVNVLEAAAPSVASIEPSSGPATGGTRVTIRGENFRSDCSVQFGDLFATVGSAGASSIIAVTPPHAPGFVDLSVQCGTRASSLAGGFQYVLTKRRAARK